MTEEEKDMNTYAEFIQLNKVKIRHATQINSNRNKDGLEVVSKNDPWINETEWDDISKESDKEK